MSFSIRFVILDFWKKKKTDKQRIERLNRLDSMVGHWRGHDTETGYLLDEQNRRQCHSGFSGVDLSVLPFFPQSLDVSKYQIIRLFIH